MEPIIIIGAGPAGLSAGLSLARGKRKVIIVEKAPVVGGLSASFSLWDQSVDLGPHRFFTKNKVVENFWLSACGEEYSWVPRMTRIYYNQKFFNYPLQPFNALRNLGPLEGLSCMLSFLWSQVKPNKESDTFESWITRQFGNRLFEIFFKTYSEKLWGIPCNKIHSDFAAQRIKSLSLVSSVFNALLRTKPRTLINEFKYPSKGSGFPYQKMADEILSLGGELYLNEGCCDISHADEGVVITTDHNTFSGSHVISTMPLSQSCELLSPPDPVKHALDQLSYRNTILVYMEVVGENPFPDNWMYINSDDLATGRITNFSNWGMPGNGEGKHILCMEYWSNQDDDNWNRSDAEWTELAQKDLQTTGLLNGQRLDRSKVVRIPKSYPVYHIDYDKAMQVIQDYLKPIKWFTPIGRAGAFKYNNQDHSILMGILAAQNLIGNRNYDLWSINSDVEYQETE